MIFLCYLTNTVKNLTKSTPRFGKGVDTVFIVGLPARLDSYIHVAGRTAREGRKGRAVTLVTEEAETERLGAFGQELGIKIEKVDVRFLRGRSFARWQPPNDAGGRAARSG